LKKATLLLSFLICIELICGSIPYGRSVSYLSVSQRIISSSSGWPTLFRLNVTYPYEAKVNEDFNIYIQLWQGKTTNVSVSTIKVGMPANQSQTLIKDQTLENPTQNETIVAERTLTINVTKPQRWYISVWYAVKDLNYKGTWTIGSNDLASFWINPQTNNELSNQISSTQKQISDLQAQQWGFIFITAYLTGTLGIAVPIIQKQRKARKIQDLKN